MESGAVLAQFPLDGGQLTGLVLGGLALMIPIVALVTHHQRKMADAVRNQSGKDVLPDLLAELQHLRNEVKSMRTELNANTIAIDDAKQKSFAPPPVPQDVSQRIQEDQL